MIRDLPGVGPHIRTGIIVALDQAEDLLEECECFGRSHKTVGRERDIEAHAVDTYVDVKLSLPISNPRISYGRGGGDNEREREGEGEGILSDLTNAVNRTKIVGNQADKSE